MSRRIEQIPIALDQLVNTLFNGWADETISSRAYRKRNDGKAWSALHSLIDRIFFWQENHCYTAYLSERDRLQCPPELRQ